LGFWHSFFKIEILKNSVFWGSGGEPAPFKIACSGIKMKAAAAK